MPMHTHRCAKFRKKEQKIITESFRPKTTITNCIYKNFMNIERQNNGKLFFRFHWKNWNFFNHKCAWVLYNNNNNENENTACTTLWVSYFCMSFILVVTIINEHVVYHFFSFLLFYFILPPQNILFLVFFMPTKRAERERQKTRYAGTKTIHVNKKDQKSTYMLLIWGHATTERQNNVQKTNGCGRLGHRLALLYNNVLSIMCLR